MCVVCVGSVCACNQVCVDSVCACNQAAMHFVVVPNGDQVLGIAVRECVEVDEVEQCSKIATSRSLNKHGFRTTLHEWRGANRVYGDYMCVCVVC